MRSVLFTLGLIAQSLALVASCGGGSNTGGNDGGGSGGAGGSGGGMGGAPPPYAEVSAILSSHNCGFCHSGMGAVLPGSMNLDMNVGAALVDVDSVECAGMGGRKRVSPGMPGQSYLIDKLKGINLCSGERMPFQGAPLSVSEIGIIEAWITGGAPTN